MSDNEGTSDGSVTATVELSGQYDEIASILDDSEPFPDEMDPVVDDMAAVLAAVRRTGGATKGGVAAELPDDVAAADDAESVLHALRVFELYDLVELDGNTWRPGPALTD